MNFIRQSIFFWIGFFLTLSLLWPLLKAPYFSHHDDVQVIRIYEMNKCFQDSQIPCRWVPDLGGMYGYPLFNFYAPLPYYFGELVYLISANYLFSAKMMFAFPFIGAYIFIYLLGKRLWGSLGGSLSAIFYSFAPYHAVVFYVRGAIGEMWALMAFPALLWSLWRLRDIPKFSNALLTAFFLSVLILSHNLSAMLLLPIFIGLACFFFSQEKNWRYLKLYFLSLCLGLVLSAFYLLPMQGEKNLVHIDSTTVGYFSYTEHFKGFTKLLLSRFWGYGDSVREVPGGQRDGMSYQIGLVHLLGLFLSLLVARMLWKKNKEVSLLIVIFAALTAVSSLMIHPRSEFVWKIVEPLKYLQFPWRFLIVVIFFISLISGSIFLWIKQRFQWSVWLVLVSAAVILNFSYFRPREFIYTSDQKYLTGDNWQKQTRRSILDFLPSSAQEPPGSMALERYTILTGETEVFNYRQGTNWLSFQTQSKSHSIIRLSQYYFPNWQIKVDGELVKLDYENTWGLMTFILGKGNHQVEGRLIDTPVRTISNWISLVGALVFSLLIVVQIKFIRKWLNYYIEVFSR